MGSEDAVKPLEHKRILNQNQSKKQFTLPEKIL